MNNSPEGAQGSANSKTPRTDAAYKAAFSKTSFRVDHFADFTRALECELKNERDGHFLLKNRVLHAANSKEARSACEQMMREEFDRDRGELIATLQRHLAQSEERVKALTEGLDKLTAWGMYCPDWADPKSKDEYAKDFMAALALLSSSKTN